jgi:uncharacterized OB-fold protein
MIRDWTTGGEGIAYQACPGCGSVWYFRRDFCPRCGASEPETRQASGRGMVHALSVVARAPSAELRAHAPYVILLVDAEEGFRMMAHGAPGLAIGDNVVARFSKLGERLVPRFEREE